MTGFVRKPCEHCPFRKDVRPYLTTERATEMAFKSSYYGESFICHKKMKKIGETSEGEAIINYDESPECAGHLTLMHNEVGKTPYDDDGFEPSDLIYESSMKMALAYKLHNENKTY